MDADDLLTEKMVELLSEFTPAQKRRGVITTTANFRGWVILYHARTYLRAMRNGGEYHPGVPSSCD